MNDKPLIYLICVCIFCAFIFGYSCYEELKQKNESLKQDNIRLHTLLSVERYKLR